MVKKTGLWLAVTIGSFAAGMALAHSSAQPHREIQFENREVRLWKSVLLPHVATPSHHHDHPRVILALNKSVVDIMHRGGDREAQQWRAGRPV